MVNRIGLVTLVVFEDLYGNRWDLLERRGTTTPQELKALLTVVVTPSV